MWTDPIHMSRTGVSPVSVGVPPTAILRACANGNLLTRREMLGRMCAGFGLAAASQMLGASTFASTTGKSGLHHAAKAKRVIFLFLNGGPSHLDTFDPKPALEKVQGQQPEGDEGH